MIIYKKCRKCVEICYQNALSQQEELWNRIHGLLLYSGGFLTCYYYFFFNIIFIFYIIIIFKNIGIWINCENRLRKWKYSALLNHSVHIIYIGIILHRIHVCRIPGRCRPTVTRYTPSFIYILYCLYLCIYINTHRWNCQTNNYFIVFNTYRVVYIANNYFGVEARRMCLIFTIANRLQLPGCFLHLLYNIGCSKMVSSI